MMTTSASTSPSNELHVFLPMYDLEEGEPTISSLLDAWWRALRVQLLVEIGTEAGARSEVNASRAAHWTMRLPERITRLASGVDFVTLWQSPSLLLGEACGLPLVLGKAGDAEPLAIPHRIYGAASSSSDANTGHRLRTVVYARANETRSLESLVREGRAVINSLGSLSGCLSLAEVVSNASGSFSDQEFKAWRDNALVSGAHAASIRAVARGDGDYAAADGATWSLLARHRPQCLQGVTPVGAGPLLPGLPLLVSRALAPVWRATLLRALSSLHADPEHEGLHSALGIVGYSEATRASYDEVARLASRFGLAPSVFA